MKKLLFKLSFSLITIAINFGSNNSSLYSQNLNADVITINMNGVDFVAE